MGIFFMIVAGAVLGWLASVICRVESLKGVLIEIAAGTVGGIAGGTAAAPIFDVPSLLTGTYEVASLLMTLVGAALVVALLNLLRPIQLR